MVSDISLPSEESKSTAADAAPTVAALQTLLLGVEGVDSFLREAADLVGQLWPVPVSCGVTTERGGHPVTVASSDARAESLDASQNAAHDGPCLQAMRTGEVVEVGDLDEERRWPDYLAHARGMGLRCSLSLPLIVHGRSISAMNLYNFDRTHAFGGRQRARSERFAAQTSTALMLAMRGALTSRTNAQLEAALTSRSVIDQAIGVVMNQQQCPPDEAFAILRTHSQNNNRKLHEVAADIVARIAGRTPLPDGPPAY